MIPYLYRYRPIKAVLDGFHELENQEIYFSTLGELNDPMEGFKDLVWIGDAIVWRNLLKHYILCVLHVMLYVGDPSFDRTVLENIVFAVPQTLPDAPIRDVFSRVSAEFLAEPAVRRFIELLAVKGTPTRRMELTSCLRALHGLAMQIVLREFQERGLFLKPEKGASNPPTEQFRESAIDMMEAALKIPQVQLPEGAGSSAMATEAIYEAMQGTIEQCMLISEINFPDRDRRMAIAFLANRFTSSYVKAIERLVHRDWYVACFATKPDDHSMWSTYGGGHTGVALMFAPDQNAEGKPTMRLERVTSACAALARPTTYGKSEVIHAIEEVRYSTSYPAIDFFRSLGTISNFHLNGFWYLGENGELSVCHNSIYSDEAAWRNAYWKTFGESALYKTPEWSREKEQRIVVHSGFDLRLKESRKFKYRFENLAGVVFGAATDFEDKLRIMRIVDQKCGETRRNDFKFFEVRYLHTQSRFQLFKLDLLKSIHPKAPPSDGELPA